MKITKFFLLGLAIILFSCSKDEDPMPTSQGMTGEWKITSLDYRGTTSTTFEGTTLKADFTGTGKDMNLTTTFAEKPNTVTSAGTYTIVLKTTMMGQTETEEMVMDEVVTDGTWSLNGRKLSVTHDSETQDATIIEQTATSLKIKVEVNESESFMGMTITTKVVGTYSFTKK